MKASTLRLNAFPILPRRLLSFVFTVFIILNTDHIVGQVLLGNIVVRKIMGITIAWAALSAGGIGMDIFQMARISPA